MRKIYLVCLAAYSLFPQIANAQSGCTGQFASALVCANSAASQGLPSPSSVTSILDRSFGTTQGTILNRGSSFWSETASPTLGLNGTAGGSIILNGATSGSATLGVKAAAGSVTFNLPITNGSLNQVLITDGAGNTSWTTAGAGTVSSVGLALPSSILTVSGSPVTGTGTLTGTLTTQSANFVWAGPTTGAATAPTFRALVGADLPNPSSSTLGGIQSFAAVGSQWIRQISISGVPTASQPAFSDISGTLAPSQCPNPSASTTGCIESYAAVANQWINAISTLGVPSSTQPSFSNLSGNATLSQLPSISNNSILANNSGGTAVPSALTTSNILDMINNVQGDVLYRSAAGWVVLAPGTNGQVLTTGGAAANPSWTSVTGTGTVTSIATNNGITGGTITTSGTLGLATIATGNALAYTGAGSGVPVATTPSALLDVIGSTTGDILYRSSGLGWQVLAPGSNGQVLTMGASTPSWSNAGTLTNVTISAGTGISTSGTCNITTTGTCTISGNYSGGTGITISGATIGLSTITGPGVLGAVGSGAGQSVTTITAPILIGTITASNSTSINDSTACSGSNCLTSTFSVYELRFIDILPASNTVSCEIQLHSGGSYQSSNYQYSNTGSNTTGTFVAQGSTSNTFIPCSFTTAAVNSGPGINGAITISNPSASTIHSLFGNMFATGNTGAPISMILSAFWNSAAVVDGFQVLMSTGNITSGKIEVWAYK